METQRPISNLVSSDVKELKVLQFVEQVCLNENVSDDELADEFVKRLVELLFSISECVEALKRKVHKIIGTLVEVGVVCRSKLKADQNIKLIENRLNYSINKKRKLDIPLNFLKDVEYSDPRFQKLVLLYQIDKKIELLSKDKMKIYSEIFKTGDGNAQLVDDSNLQNNHHSDKNSEPSTFKNKTVNKVLELESRYLAIKPELFPDDYASQDNNEGHIGNKVNEGDKLVENWKGSTSSLESTNRSSSDVWTQKSLKSPVNCIQLYRNLVVVGCMNGDLGFISVHHGSVEKVYEMHSKPITSLLVWNNRIITSSLDKSLKCFDMSLCKMKNANLNHSIESTTDDGRGVVYVGTSTGHVHRFNILPLTEIGSPVQVSTQSIAGLKVISVNSQLLLIVSVKGRPLTIRDAQNGSLIRNLQIIDIITFDVINGQPDTLVGVTMNKIYSVELGNKTVVKTRPFPHVCVSARVEGDDLYVLTNQGNIHIFNKSLQECRVISVALAAGSDQVSAFAIYKKDYILFLKNQALLKRFKPDLFSDP